jgi:two-component system, NarL family, nitrate/nitrite response regulator NarL
VIRVLLALDIPFYRDGLARLLASDERMTVVAAERCEEAYARALQARPDIMLLDPAAPQARQLLHQVRSTLPEVRVVALALDDAKESIVDWLALGISGYVSNRSGYSELVAVLHAAVRGEWSCSARAMNHVLRRLQSLPIKRPPGPMGLTARERQILDLVGQGLSNKRIAMTLHISHATAKNHVHRILEKLQLRNRAEVVAYLSGQDQPAEAPPAVVNRTT